MGPKPIYGEYVDDQLATPQLPLGYDPLIPHMYSGAILPGPAVDYNYDITTYVFSVSGTHTLHWPNTPQLIRGGLVLIDPKNSNIRRVIAFQYNPETLTRRLQIQAGEERGDRSEALRINGPPVETINLDAEIDATDQLEFPEKNPAAAQLGIFPQLAALELIIYPRSEQLQKNRSQADEGQIEIAPVEGPLILFVWSRNRVVPVRLTEFSITEEAFDATLNPIRAKVTLGMRVLTVQDLGFDHRGGNIFMAYLQRKESLATQFLDATLSALDLEGIP
jgi:hypothetical protein